MTRAIKAASSVEVGHRDVLAAAVKAIGGTERPGQVEMADAIAECLDSDHHLLVQAGTGTGKSLGYLAPALLWLVRHPNKRIVVATATLALQSQLANNDIPAALMRSSRSPAVDHGTRSSRVVPTTCVCFGCGMALLKIKAR